MLSNEALRKVKPCRFFESKVNLKELLRGLEVPRPDLIEGLRPRRSGISSKSVIPWGSLASSLNFKCLDDSHRDSQYYAYQQLQDDLAKLVVADSDYPGFQCDIGDIEGLENSKSHNAMAEALSLDELVIPNRRDMLGYSHEYQDKSPSSYLPDGVIHQSADGIDFLLAKGEGRPLVGDRSRNTFITYNWDGRIFLQNSGRSHRFAAARIISRLINQNIPLTGCLQRWRLDDNAVRALHNRTYFVIVGQNPTDDSPFRELSFVGTLLKHLALLKTPPHCCWLTCPATSQLVITIQRTGPLSDGLYSYLLSSGGSDYGALLAELALGIPDIDRYTISHRIFKNEQR